MSTSPSEKYGFLSVQQSVWQHVCQSFYQSASDSIRLPICSPICLPVCMTRLSDRTTAYLSASMSECDCRSLSTRPFACSSATPCDLPPAGSSARPSVRRETRSDENLLSEDYGAARRLSPQVPRWLLMYCASLVKVL